MTHFSFKSICVTAVCMAIWGGAAALAEDAPDGQAKSAWPHVRVDRDAGVVEVDAKVVLDKAEWLELVVCTTGSREYESVAATDARPSHIHLALMTLGLQPGNPMTWKRDDEGNLIEVKAAGPAVEITATWEKDGQTHTVPANKWIKHNETGESMPGSTWLFTGSALIEHEGQSIYMADLNGTVVSLVNFGDDILARDTKLTHQTDEGQWVANPDTIPPVGTAVTLRIKPVQPEPVEAAGDPKD
jgi:hypothetical protein